MEGGEEAVLALEQDNALPGHIGIAEALGHGPLDEIGKCSREFDSGGTAAHDDDGGEFFFFELRVAVHQFEVS